MTSSDPKPGVLRLLVLLAATMALSLPALWNGSPLFYPDTPTYLRGAEAGLGRLLPASQAPAPWLAPGAAMPQTAGAPPGAASPGEAVRGAARASRGVSRATFPRAAR